MRGLRAVACSVGFLSTEVGVGRERDKEREREKERENLLLKVVFLIEKL